MHNIITITHSFLRKEVDNSIVLILDYQPEWENKEINFSLNNNTLEIKIDNVLTKWVTELNNDLLVNSLKNNYTAVLLNAENGGFAEGIIEPLEIKKKNKP